MPKWSILIETKKPWSVRAVVVEVPDGPKNGWGKAAWLATFGMKDELKQGEQVMGPVLGADIDLTPTIRMVGDSRLEQDDYAEESLHRVRSIAGRASNWTLCGKERKSNWGSVADSVYADPCLKCAKAANDK